MGLTHVTVALRNLQQDRPAHEAEFLVDTGAIDCLAPAKDLTEAGIAVEGRDVYELANGEVVDIPMASPECCSWGRKPSPRSFSDRMTANPFWAWSRWKTPVSVSIQPRGRCNARRQSR